MGFNNYIDKTNMVGLGICCNCCGRTTQGATYVNGMYFCAKCYQDTFGSKIVNVTIDNKSIPEINKEVNVNDLEQENKVLKKALELACDYVLDEWSGTEMGDEAEKVGGFVNYFIQQAEQALKRLEEKDE